jgi:hypothetical protein
MDDIDYKNIQHSIKNLVKKYGLEGTYELIENMTPHKMKYRLLVEFDQLYHLYLKG